MRKISIIILVAGFLSSVIVAEAQIEVNTIGNSGFGISNPIAKLEVQQGKYLMFNAPIATPSGLLFYETWGKTPTSVEMGAFIEYNPSIDAMLLGTYQVNKNIGMYFYRNNAHVGIGSLNNSWTYELRVDDDVQILNRLLVGGDAWVHGNEVVTSDLNVKTDISTLESNEVLNKLIQLTGKSYQYKTKEELEPFFSSSTEKPLTPDGSEADSSLNYQTRDMPNFPTGSQYGLIAQEVKEVFPNVVKYDKELQLYGIDYNSLIPLLIEATKEQQHLISQLSNQVELLHQELINNELKKSGALGVDAEALSDSPILYQNSPNPFKENTAIRYYLPESAVEAHIIIYDMTGKQLRRISLTEDGDSNIEVHGGEVDPGMYMYSMIVENKLVDTKQMILTD